MIVYNKKLRVFMLSGKNYSYAIYVDKLRYVRQLHFGGKLSLDDADFLIERLGVDTDESNINRDMRSNDIAMECGSFAKGDFRSATVIAQRCDGAAMSSFKYKSHRITDGAMKINGMPCARKADQTLTVTLKDEYSDVEIDMNYSVSDDSAALVRNNVIRNCGTQACDIKRAYSFCANLSDDCKTYSVMRLAGAWASERKPVTTPIAEGTLRIESTRGYSSHQMNPFMAVLSENCTENSGECYGFNLLYSGSFVLTAEVSHDKSVRIQGGINDYMFSWELSGGNEFVTPQVALVYSDGGLGGMARAYADFFRDYIIDPKRVLERRPIVLNNWEATYFDFDCDKLIAIIDEAAKLGVDTFVLDDGWFGKRNDDKSSLGDWHVNESKLNGGLKKLIDRCKERGLKFGLWIEPEMISEDSDLYRKHPDWAIAKEGVEPSRERNQLILDLSKKEVVDYVYGVIADILSNNDVSYIKWDKNRNMTEFYSASLPPNRQGEFAHRYTLGFYELAERLTTHFPNVFFEGCAGGGGRFDGGALYYFPQIWTSDDTDGLERTKIQYGTSVCYPVSSMSCHVSACPNHQTQRTTPLDTRGAIASLGATGYELDPSKLTDDEKTRIVAQILNYKQISDLVLCGDLYRLSDPFTSNYFCEMLVDKNKNRAYVVGERFRGDPSDHDRILHIYGLDPIKNYVIKELGLTASGNALANAGVRYPRLPDCGSWVWHIEAVK